MANEGNLTPYKKGEDRAKINGAKGGSVTGPQYKTIIKNLLTKKIKLEEVDRKKLEKLLGYTPTEEELTQEFFIVSKMLERARDSDSSFESLLSVGELRTKTPEIEINNTTNVNVSDAVAEALEKLQNS